MAITINYEFPTVIAPTASQAKDLVTCNIVSTSTAALAGIVSHNFNLTAAELAKGFPEVILTPLWGTVGTEAIVNMWAVTDKAANTVTIAKTSADTGVGAKAQLRVHLRRPHTIGQ